MTMLISKDLAQAVLDYLSRRPYNEVYQLVGALVQLQPAPEPKPEEPAKPAEEAKPEAPPAPVVE